jgi:hypothetical protein
MANEVVVPILPCRSLKTILEFYKALGFHIKYEQHAPYVYGSVGLEKIQLDFIGSKNLLENQESSHICLIVIEDATDLQKRFSAGAKAVFGKQLRKGIPRVGSVNTVSKDQRFTVIDPSGNRLIFVQPRTKSPQKTKPKNLTPLARAVRAARLFGYTKEDPQMAADHLDPALKNTTDEPAEVRFRAFVLRADLAEMLDDPERLKFFVEQAKAIPLEAATRLELTEEIERLEALESLL